MVLDLDLFREDKGGDPERVRSSVRKRFAKVEDVDLVIEYDREWRKCRHTLDALNKSKNTISKEYGNRVKTAKASTPGAERSDRLETSDKPNSVDLSSLMEVLNDLSKLETLEELKFYRSQVEEQIIKVTQELEQNEKKRGEILREIGNLLHPDVPISDNEDDNAVLRTWGDVNLGKDSGDNKFLSHVDLIMKLNGMDADRGASIAGSRAYFLKGSCIWLQQALIQYALRFLADRDFVPIYPPFWMKKTMMEKVAQLIQFEEEMYKVVSSKSAIPEENEDKYLIATSEQPIAAFHCSEWLSPSSLPIRYAGLSTCFRQEVGAHGRDTRGIFRVHQFEKVEQFVISAPSKSWTHFSEMVSNSEAFYQSLGIPYRVVNIVSGALNNAAAMKHDIEAWFPGSASFRELVSVSNCTDYQSRRLQIRYGQTKKMTGQVEYVHMLNGTMCAITRTICAILEVHQTPEGIKVPEPLQPFMPSKYKEIIPFVC